MGRSIRLNISDPATPNIFPAFCQLHKANQSLHEPGSVATGVVGRAGVGGKMGRSWAGSVADDDFGSQEDHRF